MNTTGGPAYPTNKYDAIVPISTGYSEGMTLRDFFAAKALQALITRIEVSGGEQARDAYIIADAMLKAREQK